MGTGIVDGSGQKSSVDSQLRFHGLVAGGQEIRMTAHGKHDESMYDIFPEDADGGHLLVQGLAAYL